MSRPAQTSPPARLERAEPRSRIRASLPREKSPRYCRQAQRQDPLAFSDQASSSNCLRRRFPPLVSCRRCSSQPVQASSLRTLRLRLSSATSCYPAGSSDLFAAGCGDVPSTPEQAGWGRLGPAGPLGGAAAQGPRGSAGPGQACGWRAAAGTLPGQLHFPRKQFWFGFFSEG